MRIVMVTPSSYPSVRGNSITVERIASGLKGRGHDVAVLSLEGDPSLKAVRRQAQSFQPDLLHGFHAYAAGRLLAIEGRKVGVPGLITITGTDVNHDLFDPDRRPVVMAALNAAHGIVTFHDIIREKLVRELPPIAEKIRVIRQTVQCEEQPIDFRVRWGFGPAEVIFFLPAGVRRVKNLAFCLEPLARLHHRYPHLRVLFVGPILEEAEGARLLEGIRGRPWARYLGEAPHEEICTMLRQVDVVVNSSLSEGGMSNALLEAMSRGRAVLASDIEGNRSVVMDEVDGLLFTSEDHFARQAERLLTDRGLRRRLGKAAQAKIEREFSTDQEVSAYETFYRDLLATSKGR